MPVFCAAADLPGPGTDARIRPVQNSLGAGRQGRWLRTAIRARRDCAHRGLGAGFGDLRGRVSRSGGAGADRRCRARAARAGRRGFAEVLEPDDVAAADQAPTHERTASAAFYGEAFDDDRPIVPLAAGPRGANLFVAGHRTGAQRYSDFFLTNGKPRRRPLATSARLRRQDDANFTNRTRFLARRLVETGRPLRAPHSAPPPPAPNSSTRLSPLRAAARSPIWWSTATRRRTRCSCARTAASTAP